MRSGTNGTTRRCASRYGSSCFLGAFLEPTQKMPRQPEMAVSITAKMSNLLGALFSGRFDQAIDQRPKIDL